MASPDFEINPLHCLQGSDQYTFTWQHGRDDQELGIKLLFEPNPALFVRGVLAEFRAPAVIGIEGWMHLVGQEFNKPRDDEGIFQLNEYCPHIYGLARWNRITTDIRHCMSSVDWLFVSPIMVELDNERRLIYDPAPTIVFPQTVTVVPTNNHDFL